MEPSSSPSTSSTSSDSSISSPTTPALADSELPSLPPQPRALKRACALCRQAHTACDGRQPCQRCIASGHQSECEYLPERRRGRPPKDPSLMTDPTIAQFSDTLPSTSRRNPVPGTMVWTSWPSREGAFVPSVLPRAAPSHKVVPMQEAAHHHQHGHTGMIISQAAYELLLGQLRDMRLENTQLREEMRSLAERYHQTVRRIEELESEMRKDMRHMISMLSNQMQSSTLSKPLTPPVARDHSYSRMLSRALPFLQEYDLNSPSAPPTVLDMRKPFAVLSVNEPENPAHWALPLFVYVSPSLCHLTGYDAEDLIGAPITKLYRELDPAMLQVIKDNAFPPFPSQVGTIFNTNSVWFSKKGTLMPVTARSQFFLTEKGLAKWLIITVDAIERTLQAIDTRALLESERTSVGEVQSEGQPHPDPQAIEDELHSLLADWPN